MPVLAGTFSVLLILGAAGCEDVKTGTTKLNIVFILTDDEPLGMTEHMPTLQQFVARGIHFRNAFVTDALCCPSRATILRGQYPFNHGCEAIAGCAAKFRDTLEDTTLATALRSAGYTTALVGKYFNRYEGDEALHIPPGWDEWLAIINGPVSYTDWEVTRNGEWEHVTDYMTDFYADEAEALIDDLPRPFFLYLAPSAPHRVNNPPYQPASRHAHEFDGIGLPGYPNFNEDDVSDKPLAIQERLSLTSGQINATRERWEGALEMLLAVDEMVARIVNAVPEDSLVIYTSDNGYHFGEHRLPRGKGKAYEESIRVPLFAWAPWIEPQENDTLVLNNDIFPSLAGLANFDVPEFVDGRNIWNRNDRKSFAITRSSAWQGWRSATRKYARYPNGDREWYRLDTDPYELENAWDELGAGEHADIEDHLVMLLGCAGVECQEIEDLDPPDP